MVVRISNIGQAACFGAAAPVSDGGLARRHAGALLQLLGIAAPVSAPGDHPAIAWRRAGLLEVTGRRDGPGLVAPTPLCCAANGALAALQALAPDARLPENGALLLGERARLLALRRGGSISPNGFCRLLKTRDGGIALNLPRPEDWQALPALLGAPAAGWATIEAIVAGQSTEHLVAQGRLLGLAICAVGEPDGRALPFTVMPAATPRPGAARAPLVVDLSALWAGPLAASLLQAAGARVIKIESLRRPDGARAGDTRVFDVLNAGKASVALDFSRAEDVAVLHRLIGGADIVIESTRPRALRQLGVDADALARRGMTWVSITGHGRNADAGGWVGFGDDAAIAGGVGAAMRRGWGAAMFAGDAIADPMTGITAALAAWAVWRQGGGLVALSLAQVVAHACRLGAAENALADWQSLAMADAGPLYTLRQLPSQARQLGADTRAVLASMAAAPWSRYITLNERSPFSLMTEKPNPR